ncbi:hypothetical protein MHB42_13495 [Lysinibacillus sp. FSL K6-0232]
MMKKIMKLLLNKKRIIDPLLLYNDLIIRASSISEKVKLMNKNAKEF